MGAKKSTFKKGLDPLDAFNKPIPCLPYKSSSPSDHEEWLDELKNKGYTVVRGIANEEDLGRGKRSIVDLVRRKWKRSEKR